MPIQQESTPSVIPYHAHLQTLAGAVKVVDAQQPVLVLQMGTAIDPGLERKQSPNEDTISVTRGVIPSAPSQPFALLMVADGMGGQGHGQEASRLAVQSLAKYISGSLCSKQIPSKTFLPSLKAGVQFANRVLYERNQEQGTGMGTTMTATLVVDTTAYVAHVGDSRFYLYREPAGLLQITQDHSLVPRLRQQGSSGQKTSIPIPGAISSIAAWARKLLWRWTPVRYRLLLAISCCSVPMGCGKWSATGRLRTS